MPARLRLRTSPIDGESLLGFLARIAERNAISLGTLHGMAGTLYQPHMPSSDTLERMRLCPARGRTCFHHLAITTAFEEADHPQLC